MIIMTSTRVTQMYDIVETLQEGPEGATEMRSSEGPWLGARLKSLRKHGKTTMKYSVTCPLQQVATISVEAKTYVIY